MSPAGDSLVPGARYTTQGRTIGEADILSFAGLSGDFTPIHTDAEFAAATVFGARTAHGPLAMSVVIGLATQTGIFGERVIGLVNINWDFAKPVMIGDTIRGEVVIEEVRPASRPGRAVATYGVTVTNQRGEAVQQGRMIVVIRDP